MHIREKTGSLFVVGFDGVKMPDELEALIKERHIGGVIIFKRNVRSRSQIKELLSSIRECAGKRPFIISVDHEGGRVFRLPEPFTNVGPMADVKAPVDAYHIGTLMAGELKDVGFNVNFAPVLDINTNIKNPVIGDRAFSNDPRVVAKLGSELIRGLQENGVVACGKHFPGHGDTSLDSHFDFPTLPHTLGRLEAIELVPFKAAIGAGLRSIMTAHVVYEGIDKEYPATLSPTIINKLLRHELGYKGVVFSDDLQMSAIAKKWPLPEACIKTLQAGCDICLICNDPSAQKTAVEDVIKAVETGRLHESVITHAYRRLSLLF
ncbi:MAG: beta-N-acetylhexosaminidase [Deltaproteobacteria bacterium CG11_big_fil_rev_8_21_14_0_20_49_13]|nr:MAG: beta-N-acetylhexosaminidase [Deltaproteobacteria bacterium CG11_big_fil_rev_8_21_14_0_20_49_13]